MNRAMLESVDAVAAAARLRDALVLRGMFPELAAPLARAVAAQPSWLGKFQILYSQSPLGRYECMKTLRATGLIGEARR